MKPRIFYTKPSITDLEVSYATDAAASGWGDQCYAYINKFEALFKQHLGVNYAIATSSCTGALHMGMAALGIGPGDEVIMADTNWIATAAPIVHLGAKPVFVDILPDSWCIDPDRVVEAITPRTKAIVAVHLYGNLCDMTSLLALGEQYDIPVIEDAAEAIGSSYYGKPAGSIGKFGAFSFHGTKTLTTGEWGMFVTNDAELYERVLTLSNHGRSRLQGKQFWPDMVGFKYKISNTQAAIGCAQLKNIKWIVKRKMEIGNRYYKHLKNNKNLFIQKPFNEYSKNIYWIVGILIYNKKSINKKIIVKKLRKKGIETRDFFYPMHKQNIIKKLKIFKKKENYPVSEKLFKQGFYLPSGLNIKNQEIDSICKYLNKITNFSA